MNGQNLAAPVGHRFIAAAAAALLIAGGSSLGLNVPVLAAVVLATAGAAAVLSPLRSTRIVAYAAAALLGLVLAVAGLLFENPAALMAPAGVVSLLLWIAAWREATGAGAHWPHQLIAAALSVAALFVLYLLLSHIGSEGGFCWLPGLPVGCLP